jgi:hypothetical protein
LLFAHLEDFIYRLPLEPIDGSESIFDGISQLRRKPKNQQSQISNNIITDKDSIITYNFSGADQNDSTEFFNFMMQFLDDN